MFRFLTEEAVNQRKSFLYGSAFTIDNLTALLMDSSVGSLGLHEDVARAKAHAVIGWMKTIANLDVPARTSPDPAPASQPAPPPK